MTGALEAVLAVLLVGLLLAGAVQLGRRLLQGVRWHRPVRLLDDPVPEAWQRIVEENFPLSRSLSPEEFQRLLKLTQLFLATRRMEGAGGLELTEEIRVTVAAQACFLILRLDVGVYDALETVIVYPGAFRPGELRRHHWGTVAPEDDPGALGLSWSTGVVVLSWDSVKRGAFDPRDGRNVTLHEFAHQLDQEVGEADGVPVGLPLSALKPWAELLRREFDAAPRRRKRPALDPYGYTNQAEFFAVATETFFEQPRRLRARKPEVYETLSALYGFDPAEGLQARPGEDVPPAGP